MTPDRLREILRLHQAWLTGDQHGARADLHCADLGTADLLGASLRGANPGGDGPGCEECWR